MKKDFFDIMEGIMEKNPNVYLIFIDLGYPRYNEFLKKFPDRVINTGASEQAALDIAVGLSYGGKIPVVYTITPFYLRAWETIRTYINKENLHCVLIGAGRDDDYSKHDGFSHDAKDIYSHFHVMRNFRQYYPLQKIELEQNLSEAIKNSVPAFISVKK